MATKRLSEKATFVKRGYGQVEPNHLSARRTGQIYAQLPAHKDINVLENGQFAKYDYAAGVVDFTGAGEWLLVLNEVKLYEPREQYEDFAMIKDNYEARVYSVVGQNTSALKTVLANLGKRKDSSERYNLEIPTLNPAPVMPADTTMVPRLLKTNVGDIMTTNTIKLEEVSPATDPVTYVQPAVGNKLTVDTDGYLKINASPTAGEMVWQVVKVYTLADMQPAVKIQRIA